MTKKFLEATAKGYRYAIEHPKESAEIMSCTGLFSSEMLTMSQEYLAGKYMEVIDKTLGRNEGFCMGIITRIFWWNIMAAEEDIPAD